MPLPRGWTGFKGSNHHADPSVVVYQLTDERGMILGGANILHIDLNSGDITRMGGINRNAAARAGLRLNGARKVPIIEEMERVE